MALHCSGKMFCVNVKRGKERRSVYVQKSSGIALQSTVREQALQLLSPKPSKTG
jgi:hypothetical protein